MKLYSMALSNFASKSRIAIYEKGLNMMFIFGKVTEGKHGGPEDITKLIVECNGPILGTKGAEGMTNALKVYPLPYKGR